MLDPLTSALHWLLRSVVPQEGIESIDILSDHASTSFDASFSTSSSDFSDLLLFQDLALNFSSW